MFELGDKVVHPQYGVGYVVSLEDMEFVPGVTERYYKVSIPGGSTVWVPLDLSKSGLRKLAARGDLDRCRRILKSRPLPLSEESRFRQSELSARLKKATIAVHCEVVRDLSGFGAHKPISGTIGNFLQVTQNVLSQEWAAVEGVSVQEANAEINILLEKGQLVAVEPK